MAKGIFITATGTDVGKTYVSALIVKKLRKLGINCGYYKPALSGAQIINGKIVPGDCDYVFKQSGISLNTLNYVSYIFKEAVSPHLASAIENNSIKLNKIKYDFERIKQDFDYMVVEGAGGIACPFRLDANEKLMLTDVIKALNLDIILVASAALGTINSTLLAVEYAKHHGINVKGIILNNYDENNFMHKDNRKQIEALTGIKVITTVEKNAKDIVDLSEFFTEV